MDENPGSVLDGYQHVLNRPTKVAYADGTSVQYQYDTAANGAGRIAKITDASGSTAYAYDTHGRVTQKTQTIGTLSLVVSYTYDAPGRLSQMKLPSGNVQNYAYDTSGRMTSITNGAGVALLSSISAHPFGPINQWTFGNQQAVDRVLDKDRRIVSHSLGSVTPDAANQISPVVPGGVNVATDTKHYSYDNLSRLNSFTNGISTETYQYDANGNLTQKLAGGVTYSYTVDSASNRITAVSSSGGNATYTYDANGSLTNYGATTFTYNAAGRLTSAGGGTYLYNGLGQRVQKTVGGVQTNFVYDERGRLVGEYTATGAAIEETTYLGHMPVATTVNGVPYYIHTDHLGSPRQIENGSGQAVWSWNDGSYGATPPNQDPRSTGTSFTYNLRFPGQYFDAETGLHHNGARDYDPKIGRYIQSDPIALSGGLNTYAYAGLSPTNKSDPRGLDNPATPPGTPQSPPPSGAPNNNQPPAGPPELPNDYCLVAAACVGGAIGQTLLGPEGGLGGFVIGGIIGEYVCPTSKQ